MSNEKMRQRLEKWEALNDLADKYFDAAIKRGEPFTEGLSNWAMDKAVMEIGNLKKEALKQIKETNERVL